LNLLKASNGGAFLFEPTKPGDHFGGTFEASGGTFGRREVSGGIDMPFFDGRVKTRIAAESFYRDGYIKDLSNGLKYGDQNYYILRPSMTAGSHDSRRRNASAHGADRRQGPG
jgi:iron complex outermembrane receptor protein